MSSRAQRLPAGAEVQAFDWNGTWGAVDAAPPSTETLDSVPIAAVLPSVVDAAEIEREAFQRGHAQGERAGADAALARHEHVLRRLSSAIEELHALRAEVLRRTERDVVQLSLAIARRLVHREVTLDRELVATMARVALDRLGQPAGARVHLHPDDCAALNSARVQAIGAAAQVVADANVRRGGCVVHSDFGQIDMNIDAQIAEVERALLGSAGPAESQETELGPRAEPRPEAICAA